MQFQLNLLFVTGLMAGQPNPLPKPKKNKSFHHQQQLQQQQQQQQQNVLQGGPLPVKNGVITPINGLING